MNSNLKVRSLGRLVIHVITTLEPGGAEKQLLELCKKQSLRNRVLVIFLKGKGTLSSSFEEVNVKVFHLRLASLMVFFKAVLDEFRDESNTNSPVIHAHLPRAEIVACAMSKLFRVRMVVTKHNCERFWPTGPRVFSRIIARWVARNSSAIVCISKAVSQYLIEVGEMKIDDDFSVIYYGLDFEKIVPITNRRLRGRVFTIGTLSRLETQKNLETLIEAADIVKSLGANIRVLIFGKGSKERFLRILIANKRLSSSIEICSPVQDLSFFWKEIDLFVLTSAYEGFGLATLEAIWQGKPVLVSSTDASKELMNNSSVNLFRVGNHEELAQEIVELIKSPKKLSRNQLEARKRAEFFSIEYTANQIDMIYEKIQTSSRV